MLENVTIVIPVGPQETELNTLLAILMPHNLDVITASAGSRASSMNEGAAKATRPFIWFLHADSHVSVDHLHALDDAIKAQPDALHYFDLAFDQDGLVSLNACGANLRSRWLGVPFGDQAFCISKVLFDRLGRYPEGTPYGEDLLFLWNARLADVPLHRIKTPLESSARKYRIHGWAKLTMLYQWIWIKMSVRPALKLLWRRLWPQRR